MIRKLIYLLFVPNGGFEEYYAVPNNQGQIYLSKYWFSATISSPDYYSRLSNINDITYVPSNGLGYQEPFDSNAYAGIFIYDKSDSTNLEYIETKLTTPLIGQKCYTVSFYISHADSFSTYVVNNIGAHFSTDSVYVNQFIRLSQFVPQISNTSANPLTSKLNWTKVSGSFLAQGGEEYMIIGNFNLFHNDDTVLVENTIGTYGYIYIDSVSVKKCGEVGIEENETENITIFPNPVNNILTINIGSLKNIQVDFFDISGRKLLQQKLNNNQENIDVSALANGVYICTITSNNQIVKREKIVINR